MSHIHRDKIIAAAEESGLEFRVFDHEPVTTSQHASEIRGVELSSGAKALVVKGKKTGQHILCVIPADQQLDTKKVAAIIGEKISFARDPEELIECVPGSVPPFGSVLGLTTYADHNLAETLNFNIGLLTESMTLSRDTYGAIENPTWCDMVKVTDS